MLLGDTAACRHAAGIGWQEVATLQELGGKRLGRGFGASRSFFLRVIPLPRQAERGESPDTLRWQTADTRLVMREAAGGQFASTGRSWKHRKLRLDQRTG